MRITPSGTSELSSAGSFGGIISDTPLYATGETYATTPKGTLTVTFGGTTTETPEGTPTETSE